MKRDKIEVNDRQVCWRLLVFFFWLRSANLLLLFEINEKGCGIRILNFSLVSWHFVVTLVPLRFSFSRCCIRYFNSCHFVCHFPGTAFITFPPHYVCHFPTVAFSFSRLPFVIFPPLCLSFSCHFVCHFPAILFVIFPPLRSSVVTLPLFPPLHLSSP